MPRECQLKTEKASRGPTCSLMDLAPMEFLSIDHFSYGDKSFLVSKDRASGFIFCEQVQNETTVQVTKCLWRLFNTFGLPNILRSDGARCFTFQFKEW